MILSNQAECLSCGDKPFSRSVHDYRECACGLIAVDGGMHYQRIVHNGPFKSMAIDANDKAVEAAKAAIALTKASKTDLGVLCAVAIALRDAGYDLVRRKE